MAKPTGHPKTKRKPPAQYISRTQAVRKLQISLKDFRRLCILKGIHPRDPPRKKAKAGNRTYYFTKDIIFLSHEPILNKFRALKSFLKHYNKALGTGNRGAQKRLRAQRPVYHLDHIVKERYPSFEDALGDIDDALSLAHVFAALPQSGQVSSIDTRNCHRLVHEFQMYVSHFKALRKVFVSVKGVYYQASLHGKNITWIVPHPFTHTAPNDVDLQVMNTFLEFYLVLLHFVNLRLYKEAGLTYPPRQNKSAFLQGVGMGSLALEQEDKPKAKKSVVSGDDALDGEAAEEMKARMAKLQSSIDSIVKKAPGVDDAENNNKPGGESDGEAEADAEVFGTSKEDLVSSQSMVFKDCVFFISRECARNSLEFVIRAGGGDVSWEGKGAKHDRNSAKITHEIVDRGGHKGELTTRAYCQPQWVFDSFNYETRLPTDDYLPGVPPPAHLSPFVDDEKIGYMPERAKELRRIVAAARGETVHEEEANEEEEAAAVQLALQGNKKKKNKKAAKAAEEDKLDEGTDNEGEDGEEADNKDDDDKDEDEDDQSESDSEDEESEEDEERGKEAALNAEWEQRYIHATPAEQQYRAELEAERKGKQYKPDNKAVVQAEKRKARQEKEEKQMAIDMMPKKKRRIYDRAMYGKTKRAKMAKRLHRKAMLVKAARAASAARGN